MALTWLLVPVFGALPYVIAGEGVLSQSAQRVLRIGLGVHGDRRDRGQRLRRALALARHVAAVHAVARRHGDRRARGRDPPAAARRRPPAAPVGASGADRARAADRVDPRGRASALDPLRRVDRDLDRPPERVRLARARRPHGSLRRDRACVHDGLARRLLDPGKLDRRVRPTRAVDDRALRRHRRRQLPTPLSCLRAASAARRHSRRRVSALPLHPAGRVRGAPARARRRGDVRLLGVGPQRRLPGGLDHVDRGLRDRRLHRLGPAGDDHAAAA